MQRQTFGDICQYVFSELINLWCLTWMMLVKALMLPTPQQETFVPYVHNIIDFRRGGGRTVPRDNTLGRPSHSFSRDEAMSRLSPSRRKCIDFFIGWEE